MAVDPGQNWNTEGSLDEVWLRQLLLEHQRITWAHKVSVKPVIFGIADWKNQLGSWDPATRTIMLSRRLIQEQCWTNVLEVLKHEIAHQMVSELHHSDEGHGEQFQRSCATLGTAEWARKARVPSFGDWSQSADINPEEARMLAKAQKLMALAGSANEHEAAAAMRKVHMLYESYHLRSLAELQRPVYGRRFIHHSRKRLETHSSLLGDLLIRYFHVEVIQCSIFSASAGTNYMGLELLGRERHIDLAEYTYWFLHRTLGSLWTTHRAATGKGGIAKRNNFFRGLVRGFEDHLEQSTSQGKSDGAKTMGIVRSRSLLREESLRLKNWVSSIHPRLHSGRRSTTRRDHAAFEAGRAKGRSIRVHQPITSRSGRGGLLNSAT